MQHASERLADRMLAFAGHAQSCATMAQLAALATESVAACGMTAIASGMITGPRAASGDVFHFNNWPAEWLALYQARGFLDRDPIPRWAIVSGAPTLWSDVMRRLPAHDLGHEVFAQARLHGFDEGVVTPVRTLGGNLGLVSVGGPRATLAPAEFTFIHTVSAASLHRAEALTDPRAAPVAPRLSRREAECVTLLTQGLTEREMAARLGISEATARFHLDNARGKTGARSRTHLAAIAGPWLTAARPK